MDLPSTSMHSGYDLHVSPWGPGNTQHFNTCNEHCDLQYRVPTHSIWTLKRAFVGILVAERITLLSMNSVPPRAWRTPYLRTSASNRYFPSTSNVSFATPPSRELEDATHTDVRMLSSSVRDASLLSTQPPLPTVYSYAGAHAVRVGGICLLAVTVSVYALLINLARRRRRRKGRPDEEGDPDEEEMVIEFCAANRPNVEDKKPMSSKGNEQYELPDLPTESMESFTSQSTRLPLAIVAKDPFRIIEAAVGRSTAKRKLVQESCSTQEGTSRPPKSSPHSDRTKKHGGWLNVERIQSLQAGAQQWGAPTSL